MENHLSASSSAAFLISFARLVHSVYILSSVKKSIEFISPTFAFKTARCAPTNEIPSDEQGLRGYKSLTKEIPFERAISYNFSMKRKEDYSSPFTRITRPKSDS